MATLQANADLRTMANESDDLIVSQDHDPSQQIVEIGMMESPHSYAPSDQVGEWRPLATFTIELQQRQIKGQTERRTAVSHLEANAGAYWPGMESARLHHWITSQLNQLVQSEVKTMIQSDFDAESRPEPDVEVPSTPEADTELEPEAVRQPDLAAESQSESAIEGPSTVETEPQPTLAAEGPPDSKPLAQPATAEGQLESVVTEGPSAVEMASQPTLAAETPPEPEVRGQPDAVEAPFEAATDGQPAVETAPQPTLATEIQLEPEAPVPPKLAVEKPPQPISKSEGEPEETIQLMPTAEQLPESEAETIAGSGLEKATPTVVEIIQLKAAQPPQSGLPIMFERTRPLRMKSIRSGYPFALEVSFKLSGPGADDVAKEQAPYHSEFYVCNRTTGETLALGKTPRNSLVEGEVVYTSRLPEAMLQNPGMYRLQVVTELAEDLATPDYFEVPLLKVV